MKAQILESNAALPAGQKKRWSEIFALRRKTVSLGDVNPRTLCFDEPVLVTLNKTIKGYSLKQRDCLHYLPRSYVALRGSIGVHDDPGFGLVVNWLIAQRPLPFLGNENHLGKEVWAGDDRYFDDRVQLISDGESLSLLPGDIFVFDADKPHAWISNYDCLLIQSTVGRQRKKRPKLSVCGN